MSAQAAMNTPGSPANPRTVSGQTMQNHSCVVCKRRKVKCDRTVPCTNCVKGGVECIFRDPLPPRRRKKNPEADIRNLISRLRRYEEVMKRNGIDPYASGSADIALRSEDNIDTINSPEPITAEPDLVNSHASAPESGRLITTEGKPVYIDNNLWTSVSRELEDVEETLHDSSEHEAELALSPQTHDPDLGGSLLFGESSNQDLSSLHPDPVHIFKLWQIFLDNVNPLTKVLHTPTVQQMILDACGHLNNVENQLECLMFAIYCSALASLRDEDIKISFGESKSSLTAKYRRGTQQALVKAGLLKTSDFMVLQAFVLLLLSLRSNYDPRSLWSLSGIALRIAQRMGLHRDGAVLGLSVFETEMRRRLWWQLIILDSWNGRLSGSGSAITFPHMDTKLPLNVNDSDLYPDMKEIPKEHSGATEMIFCLMRYEVGHFFGRKTTTTSSAFDGHWSAFSNPSNSLVEKDQALDEMEGIVEQKYTRYCDKSIPLHLATLFVAKAASCALRLEAHHPRQYASQGKEMPPGEKNRFFSLCLEMAEYANMGQTNKLTERYLWHVESHFPLHALIYTLSELRHRTAGEEVERAWRLVDLVYYRQYGKVITHTKSPVHLAIGKLALKAWSSYEAESVRCGRPCPPRPEFISALYRRLKRNSKTSAANFTVTNQSHLQTLDFPSEQHIHSAEPAYSAALPEMDPSTIDMDIQFLTDVPAFEDSPIDWSQWDNLLQQFEQQTRDEEYLQLDDS